MYCPVLFTILGNMRKLCIVLHNFKVRQKQTIMMMAISESGFHNTIGNTTTGNTIQYLLFAGIS